MGLELVPITLREACAFVRAHHRHHKPPRGCRFVVGCADDGAIVGVAIVGRPVARNLEDGWTAEVTRVCVLESARNACSMLYAAAWRAARALGFRRLITYTLAEEGGASLRGAGWRVVGEAPGGTWSRTSRPRVDQHPLQGKLRWEAA
jgi:L-amino acid N-acyltransferase YncA